MCFKNGSLPADGGGEGAGSQGDANFYPTSRSSWLVPMNGTSDYIELYSYGTANGSNYTLTAGDVYRCVFEATFVRDL